MQRRQRQGIFTEINITPLTDIFLVLLIMMMVIAPMLDSQGLKLAAPHLQASSSVPSESKAITVSVLPQGVYMLGNEEVLSSQFKALFMKMKTDHPDGLVVQVSSKAIHGDIVKVLDAAKQAGLKKIAVVRYSN